MVTFMWLYDNSANGVPATSFNLTVTQKGQQIVASNVSVNSASFTLPLTQLSRGEMYNVSIFARNLQGDSRPTSYSFEIPGIAVKYVWLGHIYAWFLWPLDPHA